MADMNGREERDQSESPSIFDLFEPPPEPDPSTFGKVPVVRGDDDEYDRKSGTTAAERKTAAEAEAAGLQHWTAPATGQIPAVLANEAKEGELWGDVKGPSWQSDDPSWSGPDLADVFAGSQDTQLGDEPDIDVTRPVDTDLTVERDVSETLRSSAAPTSKSTTPLSSRSASSSSTSPTSSSSPSSTGLSSPRSISKPEPIERPEPPRGNTETRRSELDDWGADGLPTPPPDTSEGRRIPGTEPPARFDTTEISSLRQPQDRIGGTGERPTLRRDVSEAPEVRSGDRTRSGDSIMGRRSGVSLEGGSEAPVPPGIVDRSHADADDRMRQSGAQPAGTAVDGLSVDEFSEADPTAPGLYQAAGSDQYFGDGADHDDHFLDVERPGGRNLPQAIAAGLILGALVLAALWVGPEAMMVLVSAAAVLAVIELYNAMRLAGLGPATLLGLLATGALPVAAYFRGDAAFTLVAAMVVAFGMLWYLAGADNERPVLNLSLTMLGVFWIGGLGAFAGLILRNDDFGVALLLSTIVIAVVSDTMAYFGGRALGRRPFHSASPNKTWEGTMTGFVFAVMVSFAMAVMPFTTMWDGRLLSALLLGAVVGVMTPLGDLAESLVKRDLGVKDMGTIVPGHGGMLDRVDGILFALPGAYYVGLLAGIL